MTETWTTDWMSGVADGAKISELSIPGTHDSCSRTTWAALCQVSSITSQLNRGIRFLDIRCEYQMNFSKDIAPVFFGISHGVAFQYITFEEVQAQCIAFLAQNKSEFILMNVQMASGLPREFFKKFEELIAPYEKDFWYLGTDVPTVKDARGRIVLIRTFDSATSAGWFGDRQIGLAWNGFNTDGESENTWFITQNRYGILKNTLAGKLELVTRYVHIAAGGQRDRIVVNFVSMAGGIYHNATVLNPQVVTLLRNFTRGPVGVIIVDYASNTGNDSYSLESLVIQHQPRQMPGYVFMGIKPGTLLNP